MTLRDRIIYQQIKIISDKAFLLSNSGEHKESQKYRGYIKVLENEYEDKTHIGT
jgi:hypothetical protein